MTACYVNREEWEELRRLVYGIQVYGGGEIRYSSSRFAPEHRAPGISIVIPAQLSRRGEAAYSGNFAVSQKDDTTVSIVGGNLIHGLDKIAVADADLAVSASGVIYVELTYPSGTAAAVFKTAAEMPALVAGKYQEELASVTVEESKITSVTQKWKYNDIKVVGRL